MKYPDWLIEEMEEVVAENAEWVDECGLSCEDLALQYNVCLSVDGED